MMLGDSGIVDWVESGAMALTGRRDGPPLLAPAAIATAASDLAAELSKASAIWGKPVRVDGPALLGERAALSGQTRNGEVSVDGMARLVQAADGHVAVSLPQAVDVAALPDLVRAAIDPSDWSAIEARFGSMDADDVVARAIALGIPAAIPHSIAPVDTPAVGVHQGGRRMGSSHPLVLDLTSGWAGPLLTSLLRDAGARVVKVEDRRSPARPGPAMFHDLLNQGKEFISIDSRRRSGRRELVGLMLAADLVVETSSGDLAATLEINPSDVADMGTSWLSLDAYSRSDAHPSRVGSGDDTGVAGGLLVDGDVPMFVADAVAEPLTGLAGAGLAARLLGADRASVAQLALSRVAAWAAGPMARGAASQNRDGWDVPVGRERLSVSAPRSRPVRLPAAPPDAHGSQIRAEFGLDRL